MKITAKVLLKKVSPAGVSEKGWQQYQVEIDPSKMTAPSYMDRQITLVIPPDYEFVPQKGDQLMITKLKPRVWMPVDSYFNGMEEYQYKTPSGGKETHRIAEKDILLYRLPLPTATHVEIKPMLVYYNPLTDQKTYEVITNDVINLRNSQMDGLLFAIYERLPNVYEAECLGDWYSWHEAWKAFELMNNFLSVIKKLDF